QWLPPLQKAWDHSPLQKVCAHSPLQKAWEHSPVQKAWEHSPLQKDREHSPLQKDGDHSPLQKDGEHSSLQKAWEHSPLQKAWDYCPVQKAWDYPPLQKAWEHSPLQNAWDYSPVQKVWDYSPVQNAWDYSPVLKVWDYSPVQKAWGHSLKMQDCKLIFLRLIWHKTITIKSETVNDEKEKKIFYPSRSGASATLLFSKLVKMSWTFMLLVVLYALGPSVIGGLKRLGTHSNPAKGVTVLGGKFPPPAVFYNHFMRGSEPLLMKNVLNETDFPAFNKWTDTYLRDFYGDELVRVEMQKKEQRGEERLPIRLRRFLDIYETRDMYLAYKSMVEAVGWVDEGAYSELDPTAADPAQYSALYRAPWYQLNMRKGDCAFIPKRWYHYIHSPKGRNLAVNLWFSHLWYFNQTGCEDLKRENEPLNNFHLASPNQQLRSEFFSPFGTRQEVIKRKFIADCWCTDKQDAERMFDLLNKNGDIKLTWEEMYADNFDKLVKKFPQCFVRPSMKTERKNHMEMTETPHETDATVVTEIAPAVEHTKSTTVAETDSNDNINKDKDTEKPVGKSVVDNLDSVNIDNKDVFIEKGPETDKETVDVDENRSETVKDSVRQHVDHDEF
ncbi:PEG3-like protein, partial [Mya arenaria]